MKTQIKTLFSCLRAASLEAWVLPALIGGLGLIPAGPVAAQTFTTLHSFTSTAFAGPPFYASTNSDGVRPASAMIINSTGDILYGTANEGGDSGNGTVFALGTNGTGFTTLHSFMATIGTAGYYGRGTNGDGASPIAGLVLSGSNLYGTASGGGNSGNGTVFTLKTDGTGFRALHHFTSVSYPAYMNADGGIPAGGLVLSGSTLYGAAAVGGAGAGTVFALNTDGTGFKLLRSFTQYGSDGSYPAGGFVLWGNTLYGTSGGGSSGNGTVFALNTDGSGFKVLHSFTPYGSDGSGPNAGLVLSGNTLYGTAAGGGLEGGGTVFALNTDGTGFITLHSFYRLQVGYPYAGLILSGYTLYGTASEGGVFAVNTDGTGFTNLDLGYSDGETAGLVLSAHTLYGTSQRGGSSHNGSVFSISLPPPVARCKNLTVPADANCSADAFIDDGSFDPIGGKPFTLAQSPPGPYPLGETSVTLTVTDNHGASNSCVATVTVVDTTPPVITCPGIIVTNATAPVGAVVSFALTASDNCLLTGVTSSPASGSTFAIGDTTVFCAAADAAGNQATCTFTVHVKGAAEQLAELIALVQSLGLQSGTENSLIVKLRAAANALDRENMEAACGHLGAFLNEVNAQKRKALTAAQAGLLTAEVTRIGAVLDCTWNQTLKKRINL